MVLFKLDHHFLIYLFVSKYKSSKTLSSIIFNIAINKLSTFRLLAEEFH